MEWEIWMSKNRKENNTRWSLVVYDVIVYAISSLLLIWLYGGNESLTNTESLKLTVLAFAIIFVCRLIGHIYGQIWRYGGIQGYIRMIVSDGVAFIRSSNGNANSTNEFCENFKFSLCKLIGFHYYSYDL